MFLGGIVKKWVKSMCRLFEMHQSIFEIQINKEPFFGDTLQKLINSFFFVFQDVEANEIKVQVCVYAFDLLYLNGEVRRFYEHVKKVKRKTPIQKLYLK